MYKLKTRRSSRKKKEEMTALVLFIMVTCDCWILSVTVAVQGLNLNPNFSPPFPLQTATKIFFFSVLHYFETCLMRIKTFLCLSRKGGFLVDLLGSDELQDFFFSHVFPLILPSAPEIMLNAPSQHFLWRPLPWMYLSSSPLQLFLAHHLSSWKQHQNWASLILTVGSGNP